MFKNEGWKICPRCGNHPRWISPADGIMSLHCVVCTEELEEAHSICHNEEIEEK